MSMYMGSTVDQTCEMEVGTKSTNSHMVGKLGINMSVVLRDRRIPMEFKWKIIKQYLGQR